MSHEIAKLLLEHAESFLERTEAIQSAISLGMPLAEIEEYLDWLDALRGAARPNLPAILRKSQPFSTAHYQVLLALRALRGAHWLAGPLPD